MGGYQIMIAVYQTVRKHEIQAYLKSNNGTQFSTRLSFSLENGKITNPEFEWEDANEEFTYHGELYDIITLQYNKDSVQIFAMKDIRENNLIEKYVEINKSNHNKSSSLLSVLKLFSVFTCFAKEPLAIISQPKKRYSVLGQTDFLSFTYKVDTPPPRC